MVTPWGGRKLQESPRRRRGPLRPCSAGVNIRKRQMRHRPPLSHWEITPPKHRRPTTATGCRHHENPPLWSCGVTALERAISDPPLVTSAPTSSCASPPSSSSVASPSSAGVWIFLAIVAAGMIVHRALRLRRPWLSSAIAVYDETTLQDLLGGLPADPSPPGPRSGRR
jgi:hypothetical protein